MPIISSAITYDFAQHDGRRHITEDHIDQAGNIYRLEYMTAADTNVQGNLPTNAAKIEVYLADEELNKNLQEITNG